MIEDPPKLTIRQPDRRPTAGQIAMFQDVPTGFVVDAMGGAGALDRSIQALDPERLPNRVAGPALTAGNGPADVMATFAALAFLHPGDIMVAATTGYQGCASAGDRIAGMARNAGAVGLVTDGPLRDYDGIVENGLPCWCTGLTPASPYNTGPGTVGLPVQFGGCSIDTGDMIVADRDGVVVVPFDRITEVANRLSEVRDMERALDAKVAEGLVVPGHVQDLLDSNLVKFVD